MFSPSFAVFIEVVVALLHCGSEDGTYVAATVSVHALPCSLRCAVKILYELCL